MRTIVFYERTLRGALAKHAAIRNTLGHRTTAELACGAVVVGIVDRVSNPRPITADEHDTMPECYDNFSFAVDVAMMCSPPH